MSWAFRLVVIDAFCEGAMRRPPVAASGAKSAADSRLRAGWRVCRHRKRGRRPPAIHDGRHKLKFCFGMTACGFSQLTSPLLRRQSMPSAIKPRA